MFQLDLRLIDVDKKYCFLNVDNIDVLNEYLENNYKFLTDKYYLQKISGKIVSKSEDLEGWIQVVPRLVGGKGGFGSMLRAIGAQIEKTTNREACRDLSGRRLRDINEEQRLKKWISQQAEREKDIEDRKKKKLEKLCAEPRIEFKDEAYEAARADLTDRVNDSLEQGLMAASTSMKRPAEEPKKPLKKRKLLLDSDSDTCSSGSSDSEDEKKASS